ncbi:hypothetical protein AJ80_05881 [Polytolypa hystricis UAMH7299]|uniref:Indoleamine 2,3-dioxygenase n=1 Tax=Polytolypa hystricis (strain UAMH7299) TaxID=1447883 RepID=A0A2B7Y0K4_POLH7|nr:hypothetical protein AJ80_05881 [Polytolypa hystricis UAMH7299]
MAMLADPPSTLKSFPHILDNPETLPKTLDPFTITTSAGFLPLACPPETLPDGFSPLESLLSRLPALKDDGSPGLLATYELGPAVLAELPDLTTELDKLVAADGKPDLYSIAAVFRDYSFLASAYLLEPCWERWVKNPDDGYGLGREKLPRSIAVPMYRCAELLDIPPFLSYAASYCLFNYTLKDRFDGMNYSNLRLIRAFEKGHDPQSSEAGFILTHVDMVKESAALISGTVRILNALEQSRVRKEVNSGFREVIGGMEKVEACMEAMWNNSKPTEYLAFRVFIFGITSQSMFPNGVVYEGVNDDHPMSFRGESGANDSMIPLLDHLLQIPMPATPLTKILHEFRSYRPLPHRKFLSHVASTAESVGVREFSVQDPETVFLYLKALDHVRSFRWRHWLLTREYIIKRTSYPTATGGSPIVTWLPNQLFAVMDLMLSVYDDHAVRMLAKDSTTTNGDKLSDHYKSQLDEMMTLVRDQKVKLAKEVEKWCKDRGV